ncbi:uncharacterized protein MICPUCDRAFT_50648 [Micromonas pusilla CCMP1545]|uniref:Predicted protein n=1 Tax=Micromonas pusilla (strain CCMP1545) TaxID=564608 RepID=C1MIP8_MICPC|nr:uncharacterized protein MICPUCDRAFT_50648 [Micromonas pusilla CCMP1545]EEH60955.1 predicted protein [Micromonas pusilla CCMP1545]|eukprot:XP_003055703.1 predicted protein [Micromonas pusilla CCMP1545]
MERATTAAAGCSRTALAARTRGAPATTPRTPTRTPARTRRATRRRAVSSQKGDRGDDDDDRADGNASRDALRALDKLVPGTTADEARREPPPERADGDDASTSRDEGGIGIVRREVVVELDAEDANVAMASFAVRSASARIVQVTIPPPVGIAFEEDDDDGEIVVAEVVEGSNAAAVGGVAVGDVLRATSAMIPEMKYPMGNLFLGGVGRPGFRRVLFTIPVGEAYAPGATFDDAMGAIFSNKKAGDFDVVLVLERRMR